MAQTNLPYQVPYQESYDHLYICDGYAKILAWAGTILTAILFLFDKLGNVPNWIQLLITILNCVVLIIYAGIDIYVRITFHRVRYRKRLDMVDDAFGTSFLSQNSVNYYTNNEIPYGLFKLTVDVFESNFFTFNNAKDMLSGLLIKVVIIAVVSIATIFVGDQWFVAFVQLTLPILLITDLVKHWFLVEEVRKNLDEFQSFFSSLKQNPSQQTSPTFIKLILNYETSISAAAILLDKNYHKNNNARLSQEWNTIKSKYQVSQLATLIHP